MPAMVNRTLLLILCPALIASACSDPSSPPEPSTPSSVPIPNGQPAATDSTPSTSPGAVPAPFGAAGQPVGDSIRGFVFVRDGAIWKSDGTAQPTLLFRPSNGIYDAAVSPNGWIAFVPDRPDQVCIVPPESAVSRCVTPGYYTLGRLAWSPDGTQLVFGGNPPAPTCNVASTCILSQMNLLILSVGSMTVRPLVLVPNGSDALGASWSPDGRAIAFAMSDGIWLANPDGSQRRLVIGGVGGSYGVTDVRWSPDGRKLSVSLVDNEHCPWFCDTAVGTVDADGSGLRVVATAKEGMSQFVGSWPHRAPVWSPDGRSIAFGFSDCTAGWTPCREQEWVVAAAGGTPKLLLDRATLLAWQDR